MSSGVAQVRKLSRQIAQVRSVVSNSTVSIHRSQTRRRRSVDHNRGGSGGGIERSGGGGLRAAKRFGFGGGDLFLFSFLFGSLLKELLLRGERGAVASGFLQSGDPLS